MSHSIQYTISTLSGAYAQKYSVTIHDAQRLEAFIALVDKREHLAGFATAKDRLSFDPFTSFNALMTLLRYLSRFPNKSFCTHIERELEGQLSEALRFEDSDVDGDFELLALSFKGRLRRGSKTTDFVEHQGVTAKYKVITLPLVELFKEDIMNLLNLCEEAMAKDAQILIKRVSSSAPTAPPLFQL